MSRCLSSRVIKTVDVRWRDLQFLQSDNFKALSADEEQKLKRSIIANNFSQPFYVWEEPETGIIYCLDGRHRTKALHSLSSEGVEVPELLPATFIDCQNKEQAAKLVLQYSSSYAKVTEEGFLEFLESFSLDLPEVTEFISIPDLDLFSLEPESAEENIVAASLQEKFIVPPFSVLDTRQGYWQERKRAWHAVGIDSQETREDIELIAKSGQSTGIYELRNRMRAILQRNPSWDEILAEAKKRGMHIYSGASVFDPVLTELMYTWFCPSGAKILDPFAGGSVRGIVAAMLGHVYQGIDLRGDQVEANKQQFESLQAKIRGNAVWLAGDSLEVLDNIEGEYDFIFSCPPYHDLEKYSEDPRDLSNMKYSDFIVAYQLIIAKAVQKLKDNRFACFVVADIRDEKGYYRNFLQDTIDAFQHSGECKLYNEIILVNVAGSLPIRIGKQFGGYRKVGKMHQNVLVFYKGDPKAIREEFPEIEVLEIEGEALNN